MTPLVPIDVVTVPDFSGSHAELFEARTLLFLASWAANAGEARSFPLHLACIGAPPCSVRRLGEVCGARITMHSPTTLRIGSVTNKLRGFAVNHECNQLLLVDTDVLVLGDLTGLAALGACMAASPAVNPRVPLEYWKRIYAGLGLPVPEERISSIRGELGLPSLPEPVYSGQNDDLITMLPYYNSGILYAPWNAGLAHQWEANLQAIYDWFSPSEPAWGQVCASDQAALVPTILALRSAGLPFRRLPAEFHAHYLYVYRRSLPIKSMRLFHAFTIFATQPYLSGTMSHFQIKLSHYWIDTLRKLLAEWHREHRPDAIHFLPGLLRDLVFLWSHTLGLYRRYIRPVLSSGL